ncbi:hypothetical protein Ahia01_000768500 [Argonauta hians]
MSLRNDELHSKKERKRSSSNSSSRLQLEENVFTTQISHYHQTMGYYAGLAPPFVPDRTCYNNINWSPRAPPWSGWPPPSGWLSRSITNGNVLTPQQSYPCRVPSRVPTPSFNLPPVTQPRGPLVDPILGSVHHTSPANFRGWYTRYPNDIALQELPGFVMPPTTLDKIDCIHPVTNHFNSDLNFIEKTVVQKCETTTSVCSGSVTRRSWYKMPEKSSPQHTKKEKVIKDNETVTKSAEIKNTVPKDPINVENPAVIPSDFDCSKLSTSNSSKSSNYLPDTVNSSSSSNNFAEYFLKRLMKKHQNESRLNKGSSKTTVSECVISDVLTNNSSSRQKHTELTLTSSSALRHLPKKHHFIAKRKPPHIVEAVIDLSRDTDSSPSPSPPPAPPPSSSVPSLPAVIVSNPISVPNPVSAPNFSTSITAPSVLSRPQSTIVEKVKNAESPSDVVITSSYSLSAVPPRSKDPIAATGGSNVPRKRRLSDVISVNLEDNQKENLLSKDFVQDFRLKLESRSKRKKYEPRKHENFELDEDTSCWPPDSVNKILSNNYESHGKNYISTSITNKQVGANQNDKFFDKTNSSNNAPEYCDIVDILHSLSNSSSSESPIETNGKVWKRFPDEKDEVCRPNKSIDNDKCVILDCTEDTNGIHSTNTIARKSVVHLRHSVEPQITQSTETSLSSLKNPSISSKVTQNVHCYGERTLEKEMVFTIMESKDSAERQPSSKTGNSNYVTSPVETDLTFTKISSDKNQDIEISQPPWMNIKQKKLEPCKFPIKIQDDQEEDREKEDLSTDESSINSTVCLLPSPDQSPLTNCTSDEHCDKSDCDSVLKDSATVYAPFCSLRFSSDQQTKGRTLLEKALLACDKELTIPKKLVSVNNENENTAKKYQIMGEKYENRIEKKGTENEVGDKNTECARTAGNSKYWKHKRELNNFGEKRCVLEEEKALCGIMQSEAQDLDQDPENMNNNSNNIITNNKDGDDNDDDVVDGEDDNVDEDSKEKYNFLIEEKVINKCVDSQNISTSLQKDLTDTSLVRTTDSQDGLESKQQVQLESSLPPPPSSQPQLKQNSQSPPPQSPPRLQQKPQQPSQPSLQQQQMLPSPLLSSAKELQQSPPSHPIQQLSLSKQVPLQPLQQAPLSPLRHQALLQKQETHVTLQQPTSPPTPLQSASPPTLPLQSASPPPPSPPPLQSASPPPPPPPLQSASPPPPPLQSASSPPLLQSASSPLLPSPPLQQSPLSPPLQSDSPALQPSPSPTLQQLSSPPLLQPSLSTSLQQSPSSPQLQLSPALQQSPLLRQESQMPPNKISVSPLNKDKDSNIIKIFNGDISDEMLPQLNTVHPTEMNILNISKKMCVLEEFGDLNKSSCLEVRENGDLNIIAIVTDYEEPVSVSDPKLSNSDNFLNEDINSNVIVYPVTDNCSMELADNGMCVDKGEMLSQERVEVKQKSTENGGAVSSPLLEECLIEDTSKAKNGEISANVFSLTNEIICKPSSDKILLKSMNINSRTLQNKQCNALFALPPCEVKLSKTDTKSKDIYSYKQSSKKLSPENKQENQKFATSLKNSNLIPLQRKFKWSKEARKSRLLKKFYSSLYKRTKCVTRRLVDRSGPPDYIIENNETQTEHSPLSSLLFKQDVLSLHNRISMYCPVRYGHIFPSPDLKEDENTCSSQDKQIQTDPNFTGCVTHAFRGSCYYPLSNTPHHHIIHKFIKFHGHKLLCVFIDIKKYVIVREVVQKCFLGKNQTVFYRTKYRDYSQPYLELPSYMRSFALKYLLESCLVFNGTRATPLGIMLLSDAELLYHFFYSFKECKLEKCVQDWDPDNTGVFDPEWLEGLGENSEQKRYGNENPVESLHKTGHKCSCFHQQSTPVSSLVPELERGSTVCRKPPKRPVSGIFEPSAESFKYNKDMETDLCNADKLYSYLNTCVSHKDITEQPVEEGQISPLHSDSNISRSPSSTDTSLNIVQQTSNNLENSSPSPGFCDYNPLSNSEDIALENTKINSDTDPNEIESVPLPETNIILGGMTQLGCRVVRFIEHNGDRHFLLSDVNPLWTASKVFAQLQQHHISARKCSLSQSNFLFKLSDSLPQVDPGDMLLVADELLPQLRRCLTSPDQV